MMHSQSAESEPPHAAFDDFRRITRNLGGLDAEGQVPFLKYELLQALERATEWQGRSGDLERQVEELLKKIEADAPPMVAARAAGEMAAVKARYEERLQMVEGAYQAMKRRCGTLEEWCRSLLQTIVPRPRGWGLSGEPWCARSDRDRSKRSGRVESWSTAAATSNGWWNRTKLRRARWAKGRRAVCRSTLLNGPLPVPRSACAGAEHGERRC